MSDKSFEEMVEDYAEKIAVRRQGRLKDTLDLRKNLEGRGFRLREEAWVIVSVTPAPPGFENWFQQDDKTFRKEPVAAWLTVETSEDRFENERGRSVRVPSLQLHREVTAGTFNEEGGSFGIARTIQNYYGTYRVGDVDSASLDLYGRDW